MLGGDPVLQRFNATHNVSVPQPVPDSMAAVNVFELFDAQGINSNDKLFCFG